jgi:hypothetical protein
MVPRRRFLLSALAVGTAGCIDEFGGDGGRSAVPAGLQRQSDGVYRVDVAALSDGSVTVADGRIEFTDPVDATWRPRPLPYGFGDTTSENGSRADEMTATATPVRHRETPSPVQPRPGTTVRAEMTNGTPPTDETAPSPPDTESVVTATPAEDRAKVVTETRELTTGAPGSGGSDGGDGGLSGRLDVGPVIDTTDDAEHAFLPPVYDADADRFDVHCYVDEAYYEARDEHVILWGPGNADEPNERTASFTEFHDGIYRATVTDERPIEEGAPVPSAMLVNQRLEALRTGETEGPVVGVMLGGSRDSPTRTPPEPPHPRVRFTFEHDEDAGTVTVTHDGGDTVRRSTLSVEGTVIADREGADQTSPGGWQGSASGEMDGEPAVVAGDQVVVGVADGATGRLKVVWLSPDDDVTAVLGSFTVA